MVEMHVHDGTCMCNLFTLRTAQSTVADKRRLEFSHEQNIFNISHPNKLKTAKNVVVIILTACTNLKFSTVKHVFFVFKVIA